MSDDRARTRLLAQRAEACAQLVGRKADVAAIIAASSADNADDEHDPEGQTIAFERAQADAMRESALRRINELDLALRRLDAGDYAECERCSNPIGAERLLARPAARTCISCAAAAGRG